jgi:hypothetical protein
MSYQSAKKAVAIIISAYRTPHGIHDETFAQLAAQALEDYSDVILRQLVDPKNGIISESKFMPTIAELREFCIKKADAGYNYKPPPSQPREIYISPEEKARVNAWFAELVDDMKDAGDDLKAWQGQMKVGQRSSVQDQDYIDFCETRRAERKAKRKTAEAARMSRDG